MKLEKIIVNILVFITFIGVVNAIGMGVSPSILSFDDALKGSSYEKEFKIDNLGDDDIIASIEMMEHEEWFTLDPETEVRVEAGSSSKVKAKIDIPEDTPNGDYETMINIKGKPVDSAEGVGLIPGVNFKAKITVTDKEIVDGYVDNILTRDTTLNENVRFIVGFLNKGNIPVTPNAKITLKKENGEIIETFEKEFDAVKAWTGESLTAEYDTKGNPLGKYSADVQVYLNDELLEEKTVRFKILDEMPSQISGLEKKDVSKPASEPTKETPANMLIGIAIIAIIMIVGLVIYSITKKK